MTVKDETDDIYSDWFTREKAYTSLMYAQRAYCGGY
jgi:hypothetical protein